MEYAPKYAQPFTLQEARGLDVPIITEGPCYVPAVHRANRTYSVSRDLEISRLQNSIAHLQRTQDELKDALSTTPDDPDLTEAFEENEVVM